MHYLLKIIVTFNHFDDFLQALSVTLFFFCKSITLEELGKKVFIPFEINDDKSNHPLFDIDPDFHYFSNTRNGLINCNYYLQDSFNDKCLHRNLQNDCFSMIHANLRSIPKNLGQFEAYLDTLSIRFTIIGVSESWLSESTVS